jgi:hypothetical protein
MWSVWDKKTDINGYSAEWYFNRNKFLAKEETIFLKTVNGHVTNVEGKNLLANIYGIDPALHDEEFLAEYERILATPPEEEETDTTTYAELAQVYREGVNSIE